MADLVDVRTVTFDSYTTIVDVDAQEEVLLEYVEGMEDPEPVSRLWRSQTMMYTVIANDIGSYRPFYELQGLGLRYALEAFGYEVSERTRDRIRETVYKDRLRVFDDVRPAMERLKELGYPQVIVSNGDPDMLEALVARAGIEDLVDDVVSAHEIRTFKPDARIYRHAAARTATDPERILHVSGGTMRDVWGAKHAGLRTAWLNRETKSRPREHLGPEPDIMAADFHEVVARLAEARRKTSEGGSTG